MSNLSSSVSKNTSLVVYVSTDGEKFKIEKAKKLKLNLITKEEFKKKYKL